MPSSTLLNSLAALDPNSITAGLGDDGLQLCDNANGYLSAHCLWSYKCEGAYNNYCRPYYHWGSDGSTAYIMRLRWGTMTVEATTYIADTASVRCITEL